MARHSGENPFMQQASTIPQPGPSRTYNCAADGAGERPNMVISGHRQFNTMYTGPRSNFDRHADRIVAKMEQEKSLMEDTPLSDQLRKKALRDLPQCLTMKRCVKSKLSKSVSSKSKRKPISVWKRLKYRISLNFAKLKGGFKNFNYFELWHGTLKDIEGHYGSGYASYFKFLRWVFVMDFLVALMSLSLIAVPQIIYDTTSDNGTLKNNGSFEYLDIFTGNGFFHETVLYYGHYTYNTVTFIPYLHFNVPAAYFSVNVILYLISFIVLAVSVALSYRRTFIETEGGLQNVYANKIFCSWDYGIATEEAAELKSSAIYRELKELLSESMDEEWNRSCWKKFCTFIFQVVVNVLVLVILVGVGWVCWLLLDRFTKDEEALVMAVVANVIMMIAPTIFNYISTYEDYRNPRTALYITLGRTYLLGFVIIASVLLFWLIKADILSCWQTHVGTEIYRLILFDFIFSVVLALLIEILYMIIQSLRGKDAKSEFNISKHTLQIIYNQALFWVGLWYSPILPGVVTIKMLIIWYVNEGRVRKFCKPPKRTWRAAQTQTWFLMLIFVSVVLIIAVHGYSLNSIKSTSCGPFKNYNFTYQYFTENVANLEDDHIILRILIFIVTKPGSVALIMVCLGVLVYYLREQALAQRKKVEMLREMLAWSGKDKKYLVLLYNQATKGDVVKFQEHRRIDPSQLPPQEFYGETEAVFAGSSRSSSVRADRDDYDLNARFKKYS